MNLFKKFKIIRSIVFKGLRNAYAVKLLEKNLNEKGHNIYIDHTCSVQDTVFENNVRIFGSCHVAKCSVGAFTYFQGYANVSNTTIGRFCSIGPRVIIAHGEHPVDFVSTHPLFFSEYSPWPQLEFAKKKIFESNKHVMIGHDVWIGANCYIKDGINIGTGSIIAAGAIVVNDVPPYAIVGGVPAKIIKYRFSNNTIQKLLKSEWWLREAAHLLKLKHFFQTPMDDRRIEEFISAIGALSPSS